jgi:hypothetical protein
MDVAKFRLSAAAILAALALTSTASSAEKSRETPTQKLPRPPERPQLQGLNNPALKLTDSQRARINQILEGYLAEEKAVSQQYAVQGAKPGAEAATTRKQSRERMEAAVEQVLNSSQRQTLKEAQAAQELAARAARPVPVNVSPSPAR